MQLRNIIPNLNQASPERLQQIIVGLFGVIAATQETYKQVAATLPTARELAKGSIKFEQEITLACDLLEADNEESIGKILKKP